MLTREVVQERMKGLIQKRSEMQGQLLEIQKVAEGLVANVNAHNGAIQDCEYWLTFFEEQEVIPQPKPEVIEEPEVEIVEVVEEVE
jgi:hypothetical protein